MAIYPGVARINFFIFITVIRKFVEMISCYRDIMTSKPTTLPHVTTMTRDENRKFIRRLV